MTRENVTPNSKPRVCFPFESSAKQFRQGMRFPRYLVHGGIACPDGTGSTNFNFHYTPLPDSVDVFPKYAKRLIWISMVISTLYAFPLPPTLYSHSSSHSFNTVPDSFRDQQQNCLPTVSYSFLYYPRRFLSPPHSREDIKYYPLERNRLLSANRQQIDPRARGCINYRERVYDSRFPNPDDQVRFRKHAGM